MTDSNKINHMKCIYKITCIVALSHFVFVPCHGLESFPAKNKNLNNIYYSDNKTKINTAQSYKNIRYEQNSVTSSDINIESNSINISTQISIGKKLFFDKRLSANGKISCANCHSPEMYFTDGLPVSQGLQGSFGTRNSPSLLNLPFQNIYMWDGRRVDIASQVLEPFFAKNEHGLNDAKTLIKIIANLPDYNQFYKPFKLLKAKESLDNEFIMSFRQSLVAYVSGLPQSQTAFDQYKAGNENAISHNAKRGYALFIGRAQCAKCHVVDDKNGFTDNRFHSVGVGMSNLTTFLEASVRQYTLAKPSERENLVGSHKDISTLGLFLKTFKPADIGLFRTPSLRHVAHTAPYMHNGSITTLQQTIELELYYRSIETNAPIILSSEEKDDLLQFLLTI